MKHTAWITAAVCLCTCLTGCAGGGTESSSSNTAWQFCELGYNTYKEPYHIADKSAAAEQLEDLKKQPLDLTDDMTLTGFFRKDVSLKAENAVMTSDPSLADKSFSDAAYGDSWYYMLEDPAEYLTLPDDLMPSFIRICYSPKGSIIAPSGEAIIISLSYQNEEDTDVTDAFAFTWYHGDVQNDTNK